MKRAAGPVHPGGAQHWEDAEFNSLLDLRRHLVESIGNTQSLISSLTLRYNIFGYKGTYKASPRSFAYFYIANCMKMHRTIYKYTGLESHYICVLKTTMCPRNSDLLYLVSYYIKRVTTTWDI